VPEAVFEGEPDVARVKKLATRSKAKLSSVSHATLPGQITSRFSWWHLLSQDSLTEVARFVCWLILSPSKLDWLSLPLPGFLSFLHYPFRPLRLVFNFIMFMFFRQRPGPATRQ